MIGPAVRAVALRGSRRGSSTDGDARARLRVARSTDQELVARARGDVPPRRRAAAAVLEQRARSRREGGLSPVQREAVASVEVDEARRLARLLAVRLNGAAARDLEQAHSGSRPEVLDELKKRFAHARARVGRDGRRRAVAYSSSSPRRGLRVVSLPPHCRRPSPIARRGGGPSAASTSRSLGLAEAPRRAPRSRSSAP